MYINILLFLTMNTVLIRKAILIKRNVHYNQLNFPFLDFNFIFLNRISSLIPLDSFIYYLKMKCFIYYLEIEYFIYLS